MVELSGESGLGRIKIPYTSTRWPTCLFSPAFWLWRNTTQLSLGITAIQCGSLDALVYCALYPLFFNPFLARTSRSAIKT
jgi:hypothetical protein